MSLLKKILPSLPALIWFEMVILILIPMKIIDNFNDDKGIVIDKFRDSNNFTLVIKRNNNITIDNLMLDYYHYNIGDSISVSIFK